MKKLYALIIIILASISLSWALEVDVDEILKSRRVNFTNYAGPQRGADTVREIRSIGSHLARGSRAAGFNEYFRYHMKYSILRALSDENEGKYSADIFFIDRDARVDHIRNVRRIISSYLVNMYRYSTRDADTLALFLTYYNAVYRGDMDYLKKNYKSAVMRHITAANAGIATDYRQWPGRTAMLIPLTSDSKREKLRSIDPFTISDRRVIDEVKKDDGSLEVRKQMTQMKEETLEDEKERIEAEKKELEKRKTEERIREQKLQEEQKRREAEKGTLQKEEQRLITEKSEAEKIDDPVKREEEKQRIAREEEALKKKVEDLKKQEARQEDEMAIITADKISTTEKEEILKKEEEALTEKEKLLEEEKKEIAQEEAQKKDDSAVTTDKEIQQKQEELRLKEEELDKREDQLKSDTADKNIYALKLFYLKIKDYIDGGHYNNELFMINPATQKIEFKSPVTNICGRRYDIFSGGIVVITHRGDHKRGHNLTLIDRNTLTVTKTGNEDIFWRSFIEIRGQNIYAITKKGEKYYLGRFNSSLELEAESKQEVNQDSFITFFEDTIFINRADKTIMVLKRDDLSYMAEIKP